MPKDNCLNCGEHRETVKRHGYHCATVDYFGECHEEWPRHRWADWTDKELAKLGILPEHMDKYRRVNGGDMQFIDCSHQGRKHTQYSGEPGTGPGPNICIACWGTIEVTNEQ